MPHWSTWKPRAVTVAGCLSSSTRYRWMIEASTSRYATFGKHRLQGQVCGRRHGIPRYLSQILSVLLLPLVAPCRRYTQSRLRSRHDGLVILRPHRVGDKYRAAHSVLSAAETRRYCPTVKMASMSC